mgnify:CR=1 FL=1
MRRVGTLVGRSGTRYITFRVTGDIGVNDLVLVDDGGKRFLGVVRWISCANVAKSQYSPFIPEVDEETVDALGYMNAGVELLGVLEDGRVVPRITVPPIVGSKSLVYALEDGDDVLVEVGEPLCIGVYPSSGRRFDLDGGYYNYHIAVVGTTGTGKSHLVRLLVKALTMRGVRALVVDHTGQDYAPYFRGDPEFEVVEDREILPSPSGMASVIASEVGSDYSEDVELSIYAYMVSEGDYGRAVEFFRSIGLAEDQRSRYQRSYQSRLPLSDCGAVPKVLEPSSLKEVAWRNEDYLRILQLAMSLLGRRSSTIAKVTMRFLVSGVDLERFNDREYVPQDVAEIVLEDDKSVVLDLSNESMAIKWSLLKDVSKRLWEGVQERGGKRVVVVVDEAQNYASQGSPTAPVLEEIARRGRKFGVGLVLASQRWVTDLSTGIRNNINTVFFSQLAVESDVDEISKVVATSGVDLASLDRGYFYVSGLLNPLRKPLLLYTFPSLEEVASANAAR